MSHRSAFSFLVAVSLFQGVVAVADQSHSGATTGAGTTSVAPSQSNLTDGQIYEILSTANRGEIMAAKIAKKRASDAGVKDFANEMIVEHGKNSDESKRIAKKAGIKPAKNEMAKALEKDAKAKTNALKKLKGMAFDSAYISQQVAMHETLLNDLETKLIPSAQNPEMRAFLEKTKSHVQAHLDRARTILASQPQAESDAGTTTAQ